MKVSSCNPYSHTVEDIVNAIARVFEQARADGEIDFHVVIEAQFDLSDHRVKMKILDARTGDFAEVPKDVAIRASEAQEAFIDRPLLLASAIQHCWGTVFRGRDGKERTLKRC